jgi:hypothetical protein
MKKLREIINGEHKAENAAHEAHEINTNIVEYLMKNIYLQNKIEFYMR